VDFLVRFESRDLACALPELYGVTVNHLSGTALSFLIIVADGLHLICDVSILAYDVGIVALHWRPHGFGRRRGGLTSADPKEGFLILWAAEARES
jgi:hypothetical protein